jgi:diadenosine tetraphosphate (Ap4A) HIT family hydrolase
MGPFDRFNDRAKRVLALAQDEAVRMNHDYLGVEHLLLGLMREGEGVAAHVLNRLGIELSKTRAAIRTVTPPGSSAAPPSEITLTPRMKKVIEMAIEEAKRLGHRHVGTEHLLLALAREGESVATSVLGSFGVALEKVRNEVIETIGLPHAMAGAPPEVVRDLFDAGGRKRDWYCEDVLSGKLQVRVLYDDERVLGFEHPYPMYQIHGVVIPRAHVASLLAPEALHGDLLTSMLRGVQAVARALELEDRGFQLQANAPAPGVTPHMHWHVVGPGLPPVKR